MVLSGDPRGFRFPAALAGEEGDPLFGFISGAIGAARGLGRIFRRRPQAITRAAQVISARPVTSAIAGGVAAGGAGAALESLLAGRSAGGMMGVPGGFTILRASRTGRPTKILTPQGRVISLVRRRGGISAAAIRGAFKLARLAHSFGGVARTGRRPRRRTR